MTTILDRYGLRRELRSSREAARVAGADGGDLCRPTKLLKDIVVTNSPPRSSEIGASKSERMVVFLLADLEVTFTGNEIYKPVIVHADRAYKVLRLALNGLGPELVNDIILTSLKKLISGLFSFEFVLPLQLSAQRLQRLAELHVHDVCGCQFSGKRVQELGCLAVIGRLARRKKLLDEISGGGGLVGHANRRCDQCDRALNLRHVHSAVLHTITLQGAKYSPAISPCKRDRGVSTDFLHLSGTGAGRHAHDLQRIIR